MPSHLLLQAVCGGLLGLLPNVQEDICSTMRQAQGGFCQDSLRLFMLCSFRMERADWGHTPPLFKGFVMEPHPSLVPPPL